jgi:ergothioneine biosynthesis protein EgtB
MSQKLVDHYQSVRAFTFRLIEGLSAEDTVVQPVADVSPPKWHLAHTTWFFENFILKNYVRDFKPFHPVYDFLFNSYYQSQGERVQRDMRGVHPRPLLKEIVDFRNHVDGKLVDVLNSLSDEKDLLSLVELGIHHEQQHQELLLTDLKFIWSYSPLYPVYQESEAQTMKLSVPQRWLEIEGGMYEIGNDDSTFHFDNEAPRHRIFLDNYAIASRPVTVGEYLEFMNSGGYDQWQHWLHEGWQWRINNEINCPLYWHNIDKQWYVFTLQGLRKLNEHETLTHISFFEADAYARWKGLRLPTEQEWEVAASKYGMNDSSYHLLNRQQYHPGIVDKNDKAFIGQVWEWTNSAYLPYPRFEPWKSGLGEYNGKFMINQMVLRGGSCATPQDHIRLSYRNFFHPHLRWQFTGIRLAKNTI